ncbi:MAG: hypothetical protein ABJI29_01660, partial [Alphaproteobacteria bacterium]
MTMLPRLQAEEALGGINVGVLTSGHASSRDLQAAVNRLEAVRDGRNRKRAARPTPEALKAIGIEVVTVPP